MTNTRSGPLKGLKVVELAGIGPAPLCAMLLADLGATVLRIDRPTATELGVKRELKYSLVLRNRNAIALDLKQPDAAAFVLELLEGADVLLDPFRPGVIERLGLGPEECWARNPRLIIGRVTGWGQDGPMAKRAGHDLNYIALSGVLHAIGRADQPPTPPLNLVGDNGGGAMFLALGILSAIFETRQSGQGQIVDAAMSEGAASLATIFYGIHASGEWDQRRGYNYLDSGAPYYDCYPCADGKWLSVASIEERFYLELLKKLGFDPPLLPDRADKSQWPQLRKIIGDRIAERTRDEWSEIFKDSDACVAPVLDFDEAPRHPHAQFRGSFVEVEGVVQPAPAPRFSRTPAAKPTAPRPADNQDLERSLSGWLKPERLRQLQQSGLLTPVSASE